MSCPKHIYLIRHGESVYNQLSRSLLLDQDIPIQDPSLSAQGIVETQSTSLPVVPDCIVCSPLQRGIQTALLLRQKLSIPIIVTPLVRERMVCTGDKGTLCASLKLVYPCVDWSRVPETQWWDDQTESDDALRRRAIKLRSFLAHLPYERIVVVCHSGITQFMTGQKLKNCEILPYLRSVVYSGVYITLDMRTKYVNKWDPTRPREPETFKIFKHFLRSDRPYLDVGACYGQTVMYGAQFSSHTYGIEPDPVAFVDFQQNVAAGDLDSKVTALNMGLADHDGTMTLAAHGSFGNSKSTLIPRDSNSGTVDVPVITIEALVQRFPQLDNINFIKMDIEGGERIVIPAIASFLRRVKPTLYISLHTKYGFITEEDTRTILDVLYAIYPRALHRDLDRTISKDEIMASKMDAVIFTTQPVV